MTRQAPETLDARAALSECRAALAEAREELAALRAENRELLAHARATVAATRRGELDAALPLAGLLEERGELPAPDANPSDLLDEAYKEARA